jgi:hypothetical protein
MKKLLILITVLLFTVSSCHDDIVLKNTPENVFLAFWNTMNERYVYFKEKKIDWDSIYTIYYPKALAAKDENELFGIMSEIVVQFKDSHLSLAKNSKEVAGYLPDSFFYYLVPMMHDYGFMPYAKYYDQYFETFQHATKNYAYVSYSSFYFVQDLSFVISNLDSLNYRDGLILDIRNNSGGYVDEMFKIASLFYDGEKVLFYKTPKISKGKDDFSTLIPVKYTGKNTISSTVPIILLTGARTYSAGNLFAYIMKDLPNCITVGKRTSGGGSPFKSEYMPNGWVLNYPYIKNLSTKGVNMENGLEPDVFVNYNFEKNSVDTHLIKALSILDSINSTKKIIR